MIKTEKGAVLEHGVNFYRRPTEESFARLLGGLPAFEYGENIELRSLDHPEAVRRASIRLMPPGWFKGFMLASEVSLESLEENLRTRQPRLNRPLTLTRITYALFQSHKGDSFILAKPTLEEEEGLQAERQGILNIANASLHSRPRLLTYTRPLDLTLAHIAPDSDPRLIDEISKTLSELPRQENIELEPFVIEYNEPTLA